MAGAFLSDIQTLRKRAREHIAQGAVTPGYHADRDVVLRLLNEALATEIICVLRYKRHYFMAQGIHSKAAADEFLEHAIEEQQHADQLAYRITQLNGSPNLDPAGMLTRSALGAYQKVNRIKVDCWPTAAVLDDMHRRAAKN